MKKISLVGSIPMPTLALALVFAAFTPAALAQATAQPVLPTDAHKMPEAPSEPAATATSTGAQPQEEELAAPLQIGDATRDLFGWQASGEIASSTPRPIAGAVAYRSYERYLKSFEYPIPERLNSSVRKAASGTGSQ